MSQLDVRVQANINAYIVFV